MNLLAQLNILVTPGPCNFFLHSNAVHDPVHFGRVGGRGREGGRERKGEGERGEERA